MKTYILATMNENTGKLTNLKLPLLSMRAAVRHANELRSLVPSSEIFVINTKAL